MTPIRPKVSCIIPAYNRFDHFSRCLLSVIAQDVTEIEIIVSDDSTSEDIRHFTRAIQIHEPRVVYVDGPRSGRPVDNWNHGLSAARGEFLYIIHQDEFLIDPTFLSRAVAHLEKTGADTVFGHIIPLAISRNSNFLSIKRIALALGLKPWTLYAINWIGPTATMVFRASAEKLFDDRLVNTVDVDFYYRFIGPNGRPDFIPGLSVSGLGHHDAQITAKIDTHRASLAEIANIISRRPGIDQIKKSLLLTYWKIRRSLNKK